MRSYLPSRHFLLRGSRALRNVMRRVGIPTARPSSARRHPVLRPLALHGVIAVLAATALGPVAADAGAQAPPTREPGAQLRVWLVTAGPGDAVWERYGHNALRVLDTETGRDVSYNWGIFDFDQVDFIPRFLQGRMLYMMAPSPTGAMIDAYGRTNREIVLQELDLTPAEKLELQTLAEINARPENRDYTYQYFLDNCSTRVRDLLNVVLDGALEAEFGGKATGTSYRFHTRRLNRVDPLIYTGMDLLMGTPTDQPLTVWEEMFLPLTLRDEIRTLRIERPDGSARPLVMSEEVAVASTRPPAADAPPSWLWVYGLLGLALGALFSRLEASGRHAGPAPGASPVQASLVALATVWSLLGGLAGTILVLLLFTDHTFAYWNENLFLLSPLQLALAAALVLGWSRPAWRRRAGTMALVLAAVSLVGLVWQLAPMSRQANAMFIALALPAHLGMAWGLRRATGASSAPRAAGGGS